MKTKHFALFIGLCIMGLLSFTGCYTQIAKPDRDEEPTVAAEPEQEESEEQAEEESSTLPRRTNVYVYGGFGYPYYYDPFGWPYYPWRSGVYVNIGYRDPWSWCGSPWYYSWDCDYYYGWHGGWPSYYTHYYSPYYYGRYYDDDFRYPVKQRSFGRRGRSADDTPVAYGGANNSRPSISKVRQVVYARNTEGALQRRTRRDGVGVVKGSTPVRESVRPIRRGGDGSRREAKGGEKVNGAGNSGNSSDTNASGGQAVTRTRKQSPPASPPAGGGGSSTPPVKRSGGSVSKPSHSGGSGNSGNSGSSNKGSGSSGGSNRRVRP